MDFRASIYLPFCRRIYLVVAAGKEKRDRSRLDAEGQTDLTRVAFIQSLIAFLVVSYSAFGVFCFVYLIKSLLNINIFSGPSPLHPLYALFVA